LDAQPEVAFRSGQQQKGSMKKTFVVLAILLAAGLSSRSFGSVLVLGPTDAANDPPLNGTAAINTTSSQAAIGTGAWQANGTAVSQLYLYANANSSTELGLGQLTVSQLSSLSLSTFLSPANAANAGNWFLSIYTAPYTGGEASWYGNRLILEPYLAANYSNPGNQWNTFSTASGANQLRIDDTALSSSLGFYGEPTLATAQSGSINWSTYFAGGSSTPIDYGSQNIKYIVLSTASGWAAGFNGMVDNVNINSTQGNVQFDLEAVPEPSTLALLGFGLAGLVLIRKRK
jgi:hypothetical protein